MEAAPEDITRHQVAVMKTPDIPPAQVLTTKVNPQDGIIFPEIFIINCCKALL